MKPSAVRIHLACRICGEEHTVLEDSPDEDNLTPLTAIHCGVPAELRGVTTLYELADDDEEEAGDGEEDE